MNHLLQVTAITLALSLVTSGRAALVVSAELDTSGLGLLALPVQAVAAGADMMTKGISGQNLQGLVGALPASGWENLRWMLRAEMANYGVVNVGALNVTWASPSSETSPSLVGLRLGVLNTTIPAQCDGVERIALRLTSTSDTRALSLAKIGAATDATSVLIKYRCSP